MDNPEKGNERKYISKQIYMIDNHYHDQDNNKEEVKLFIETHKKRKL